MRNPARHHDVLRRLQAEGSLTESLCSRSLQNCLASLIHGGVLAWEKAGSGRRLTIQQVPAFNEFLSQCFPMAAVDLSEASSRVRSVGQFRNTKTLRSDLSEILAVRAWQNGGLRIKGIEVDVAAATQNYGVFAFMLGKDADYSLHGRVALVENAAVFSAFEELGLNARMVIYGHGRISSRMLNWFASSAGTDFSLLHLADYDPVGLCEFDRLHQRLGKRVEFYVPDNLAELFQRFSNRTLLQKEHSQALFSRLRQSTNPAIRHVVALIEKTSAGLEHEALLATRNIL